MLLEDVAVQLGLQILCSAAAADAATGSDAVLFGPGGVAAPYTVHFVLLTFGGDSPVALFILADVFVFFCCCQLWLVIPCLLCCRSIFLMLFIAIGLFNLSDALVLLFCCSQCS